jgi:hypothetical protein
VRRSKGELRDNVRELIERRIARDLQGACGT